MDDTLKDGQKEPEGKSNQVHKAAFVFKEKEVDTIVVPLHPEGRHDGHCDDVLVDLAHEFAVKHRDHDPSEAGWDVEVHLGVDALGVLSYPGVIVHQDPEEEGTTSEPEAVQAVPSHGTGVVNITDKVVGSVLHSLASITAVNLCVVTHSIYSLFSNKL